MRLPSLSSIIETAIGLVGPFALGYGSSRIVSFYRKQTNCLKKFSPLNEKQGNIVICHGLIPPGNTGRGFLAEEGDLAALYTSFDVVSRLYGSAKATVEEPLSTFANFHNVSNVLALSGPKHNKITEFLIGQLGSPVRFDRVSGNLLFTHKNGKVDPLATERALPHLATKCYGLMLAGRLTDSSGKTTNAMVCAGNSTLGTFGAASYLRQMSAGRSLIKVFRKHGITPKGRWGLILEVKNNLQPSDTGGVWLPMAKGAISIKVDRYLKEKDFFDAQAYHY